MIEFGFFLVFILSYVCKLTFARIRRDIMTSVKDIVLVGHFALDTIIMKKTNTVSYSLGGGVTYGSLAASYYDPNADVGIVSRIGTDFDRNLFNIFANHKIDMRGVIQEGPHSTGYQLTYHEKGRDLKLLARAPDINIKDFPESFIGAKAIHMTPIADEFNPKFIESLADHEKTQNTLIGIDVQGMIRGFDKEGNILLKNDLTTRNHIYKMLQQFGSRMFFKASDNEARAVTGIDDLLKATEYLGETGASIFTTLGEKGLYFKFPKEPIKKLNAYCPKQCVDETGAGDCFSSIYLLELAQMKPEQRTFDNSVRAAKMASASASFLIEEKGPHGFGTKVQIADRVAHGKEL